MEIMQTKARVYFKLWAGLNAIKQLEALRAIQSKLCDYVSNKAKALLPDASTEVVIDEESEILRVTISSPTQKFTDGGLSVIIREFLVECQEPQLVGFEMIVGFFATHATVVVGGGREQLCGDMSKIAVRFEF